ncbi:hypothetical protein LTR91_010347 [Friedmanniomyces endolithicus]|uniref:Apple domain-containing protein n=1 Tax=Friedmanniomyces endolithicus TaxID=329885 RepID=A0AAN6KKA3_9PEZI|nr:hypothetical protein LTR03_001476 [Friedmanniomyces endolithicus]KAK0861447.1 hypothetical protein LTS02_007800 [Friedmanniomyces endolithicus]KAK0882367.1 hypothetical protein LTR87_003891 [Friedmanniomyces endolithicus]KAK0913368.1 hypothetical protein LTR02_002413 [Friedmanniomyces endolithicus]KAK0915721.1 hypothetical protein LTR57_013302 [Friedmanniomyces endolithicus]
MRQSFFASALCLSIVQTSVNARAHDKFPQLRIRNGQPVVEVAQNGGMFDWAHHFFRRHVQPRQSSGLCVEDSYYNIIQNLPNAQSFCQGYMNYPNETVTMDYTPTSTYTDVFTTETFTETEVTRTTPIDTVTVTQSPTAKARREADAQITARAVRNEAQIAQVFDMWRRQNGDTSSTGIYNDTASMSSAYSSACACQNYGNPTVTETYTDDPTVLTLAAFQETTTTTTTTRAGRATTTTVIVNAPPPTHTASPISTSAAPAPTVNMTAVASTTSSTTAATPTSPPLVCPDDDGDVVSQMVGAERFDYLLHCSTDLTSSTFYGALYYSTLGQCVSACSYADANFSSPVCQGISYYNSPNVDGYNCFLKTSGNGSVPMAGVDSAILLRIVMGIDNKDPSGTTTEAVPFGGTTSTQNSSQMSSSISKMMGNSTSSMPMITPGPPMPQSGFMVNAGGYTSYSTFVSNGSTISTGTVFSTYYTSGGSWYESYYTSYSLQWASATTEYAVGAQQTQVAGTNSTSTSQSGDGGGGYSVITNSTSDSYYPGGYNVTEVISNQTYAANGTEVSSSATTNHYSYQTGGGGGSSGGSSNGSISSNAAGVTSTSLFSSQTIIVNSGATGGASGYYASGGIPMPSNSATATYASGGTAYSSGYMISGGLSGTGGASGYQASGSITSMPSNTSVAVIGGTNGTAYSSGFAASGALGGTGGMSGTAASGGIPSLTGPVSTPNAPRTGDFSTTSAAPSGEEYPSFSISKPTSSDTAISSGPAPYPTTSGLPRTGEYSTTTTSANTSAYTKRTTYRRVLDHFPTAPASSGAPAPSGNGTRSLTPTAPPMYPSLPASSGSPVPSPNSTIGSFSDTGLPRTGSQAPSSVFPTGTAPTHAPSSCSNYTMGTTTMLVTTTVYGCFASCAPAGGYGYGGQPQSFGGGSGWGGSGSGQFSGPPGGK